jgi:uncharacterized Ntn-hydrolase superfamily protein
MTTTIMGRCERTNRLGIALATNTLASGGLRFYHAKPVGIVAHQSAGDFDLALLGFRLLETGFSPDKIVADLAASDRYHEYRQVGALDRAGAGAASTGGKAQPWSGHIVGDNHVAMANSASSEAVLRAMAEAFTRSRGEDLDERLLRALEAERDAGGQPQGQRSSFLVTFDREHYPLMDLRVDAHAEPIGELRRVHALYKPYIPLYYYWRPKRPDVAPSQAEWVAGSRPPGSAPPGISS